MMLVEYSLSYVLSSGISLNQGMGIEPETASQTLWWSVGYMNEEIASDVFFFLLEDFFLAIV